MAHFLNGLVFFKRGKDDKFPAPAVELPITNNLVLKKLRVAFELKDTDMHQIFTAVDFRISAGAGALFRKEGTRTPVRRSDAALPQRAGAARSQRVIRNVHRTSGAIAGCAFFAALPPAVVVQALSHPPSMVGRPPLRYFSGVRSMSVKRKIQRSNSMAQMSKKIRSSTQEKPPLRPMTAAIR